MHRVTHPLAMVTSHTPVAQHQNQEAVLSVGTSMLITLQILLGFHQLSHALIYVRVRSLQIYPVRIDLGNHHHNQDTELTHHYKDHPCAAL